MAFHNNFYFSPDNIDDGKLYQWCGREKHKIVAIVINGNDWALLLIDIVRYGATHLETINLFYILKIPLKWQSIMQRKRRTSFRI